MSRGAFYKRLSTTERSSVAIEQRGVWREQSPSRGAGSKGEFELTRKFTAMRKIEGAQRAYEFVRGDMRRFALRQAERRLSAKAAAADCRTSTRARISGRKRSHIRSSAAANVGAPNQSLGGWCVAGLCQGVHLAHQALAVRFSTKDSRRISSSPARRRFDRQGSGGRRV